MLVLAMPFTQKSINAFEMDQRAAACEIAPGRPGYRTFIGVYPPRHGQPRVPSPLHIEKREQWLVKKFTIPERLVNEHFGNEDLIDHEVILLNTLGDVEELLARWAVDSAGTPVPLIPKQISHNITEERPMRFTKNFRGILILLALLADAIVAYRVIDQGWPKYVKVTDGDFIRVVRLPFTLQDWLIAIAVVLLQGLLIYLFLRFRKQVRAQH